MNPDELSLRIAALSSALALCEMNFRSEPSQRAKIIEFAVDCGTRACALAETLQDTPIIAFFKRTMAEGYLRLGEPENAREMLLQSASAYRRLCRDVPRVYLGYLIGVLCVLASAEEETGHLDRCLRTLKEAASLCIQSIALGQDAKAQLASIFAHRGTVTQAEGDVSGAIKYLSQAVFENNRALRIL